MQTFLDHDRTSATTGSLDAVVILALVWRILESCALRVFLALLFGHLPPSFQVGLVANQGKLHILNDTVRVDLILPILELVQRRHIRHVVNHQHAVRVLVVPSSVRSEALRPAQEHPTQTETEEKKSRPRAGRAGLAPTLHQHQDNGRLTRSYPKVVSERVSIHLDSANFEINANRRDKVAQKHRVGTLQNNGRLAGPTHPSRPP